MFFPLVLAFNKLKVKVHIAFPIKPGPTQTNDTTPTDDGSNINIQSDNYIDHDYDIRGRRILTPQVLR